MPSGLKLWGIMTATAIVLSNDSPTLVKAAARLAKVVFGNRIQICDGVADQVEIQAAIDAVPATGGKVTLLEGNYSVNQQGATGYAIGVVDHLELELLNGAIITLANNQDCDVIARKAATDTHIFIHGGDIDGNKANQASGYGIHLFGDDQRIENVYIHDCKQHGIAIAADGQADNIVAFNIIKNCDMDGIVIGGERGIVQGNSIYNSGDNGINAYHAEFITISDNVIKTTGDAGIALEGAAANNTQHCTVSGNTIEDAGSGGSSDGIVLNEYAIQNTVIGNTIKTTTRDGIGVLGVDNTISGNTVEASTTYGIRLGVRSVASGNIVISSTWSGIALDSADGSLLSANIIRNCQQTGIRVIDSRYCTIMGNKCLDNNQEVGNYDGIQVYASGADASSFNTITGNVISGASHRYGIYCTANASSNTISGNIVDSYGTAAYYDLGTKNVWGNAIKSISLDLSGGATDIEVFHAVKQCYLVGYLLVYTEATSADVGVGVRVGRYQDGVALDDDYFDLTTSDVSQNKGYSRYLNSGALTQKVIAAGDTVTVGTAGGKLGTGEVMLILQIAEMAD